MKKLLALLLLFGIVGCASVAPGFGVIESSHDTQVFSKVPEGYTGGGTVFDASPIHYWRSVTVSNYDNLTSGQDLRKGEAMNIATGETFHIGNYPTQTFIRINEYEFEKTLKDNCYEIYKSECVISKLDDEIYYSSQEEYRAEQIRRQEYVANAKIKAAKDERELQETIKREQEEKKMAVIHALKERCISYGFTGSNNIAACVQREAQHDYDIEQKEYELQLARQQLLVQQNQQQVPTQVPWYLSILEGVAEGVAEGYRQQALIRTMDSRYERKDIYRYCRPNC